MKGYLIKICVTALVLIQVSAGVFALDISSIAIESLKKLILTCQSYLFQWFNIEKVSWNFLANVIKFGWKTFVLLKWKTKGRGSIILQKEVTHCKNRNCKEFATGFWSKVGIGLATPCRGEFWEGKLYSLVTTVCQWIGHA